MQQWQREIHQWFERTTDFARTVGTKDRYFLGRNLNIWLLAVFLGIGAGMVGPFGTYLYAPLNARIVYWVITMVASFHIWWAIDRLGHHLFPNWPYEWAQVIIIVPFTAINSLALVGFHLVANQFFGSRFPLIWTDFFLSHIALSSIVVMPTIILARRLITNAGRQAGSDAIQFLTEKLPPKLRGAKPFALAAEGHYVRVFTSTGEDLITMKFEDAVKSVAGIPGQQTHRSWWVALDAIREMRSVGSAYEVELTSGLIVPVGRRRRADLANAWTELKTSQETSQA